MKKAKKLTLAKETLLDLGDLAAARGGSISGNPAQTWQGTCAGCAGTGYSCRICLPEETDSCTIL